MGCLSRIPAIFRLINGRFVGDCGLCAGIAIRVSYLTAAEPSEVLSARFFFC